MVSPGHTFVQGPPARPCPRIRGLFPAPLPLPTPAGAPVATAASVLFYAHPPCVFGGRVSLHGWPPPPWTELGFLVFALASPCLPPLPARLPPLRRQRSPPAAQHSLTLRLEVSRGRGCSAGCLLVLVGLSPRIHRHGCRRIYGVRLLSAFSPARCVVRPASSSPSGPTARPCLHGRRQSPGTVHPQPPAPPPAMAVGAVPHWRRDLRRCHLQALMLLTHDQGR